MLSIHKTNYVSFMIAGIFFICFAGCIHTNKNDANPETLLSPKEKLGKLLFFDESLSEPSGQSCATCHDPTVAFADPNIELPVSKGAIPGLFGNRNDMTISYAAYIPELHYDKDEDVWIGGFFWDGRANTLAEQAMGPFLNPLEMANPDTLSIFNKLKILPYVDQFIEVYGSDAIKNKGIAFKYMADAIQAYEMTTEVNPFSSKYDHWMLGKTKLTEQEIRGMSIFMSEEKGNCAACHPNVEREDKSPPLFTDFTYDNLGTPRNPENPYYMMSSDHNPNGYEYIDLGLGITVNDPNQNGKFRVPTLRNVAITAPYMHNGVFKTLFNVIAFYNTRDISKWPEAEVKENVNFEELGDLKLTNQEIEDLVAFLQTLTDGWQN